MLGLTIWGVYNLVFNINEKNNFELSYDTEKNGQWVDTNLLVVEDEWNIQFDLNEEEKLTVAVYTRLGEKRFVEYNVMEKI